MTIVHQPGVMRATTLGHCLDLDNQALADDKVGDVMANLCAAIQNLRRRLLSKRQLPIAHRYRKRLWVYRRSEACSQTIAYCKRCANETL